MTYLFVLKLTFGIVCGIIFVLLCTAGFRWLKRALTARKLKYAKDEKTRLIVESFRKDFGLDEKKRKRVRKPTTRRKPPNRFSNNNRGTYGSRNSR